jgi:phenylacetate-CoA ligase
MTGTPRDWKMEVYWRLPVRLQEAALAAYARKLDRAYYSPAFEEWRARFQTWKTWSASETETWQRQRLAEIVQIAATRVPYYRAAWRGIDWKAIQSVENLGILPRLERQAIRENEGAFLVEGLDPKRLWKEKTSGTTGTFIRIYWPAEMLAKHWALMEVMVRNTAGVGRELPRAMIGSRAIVRGDARQPPYWRFNRRWRQLYLSSYHVSRESAGAYVEALRRYGSEWITGYGSAIAALAGSALEAGVSPLPLRAAIVSGDTLLPGMRARIEEFFQCRCFDHYGQCEGVAMAIECSEGRMHVIPFEGIVEVLRDDGSPCAPGEVGEIVATGLLNDAMPFVRYRMGDHAAWAESQQCGCGSPHRILESIRGRLDDYILTATGRKIGRFALRGSPAIHSLQLVQDSPSHAFLLVRPGPNYERRDADRVRGDISARAGDLVIDVAEVGEIPKTRQGKTILVVRLAERPEMRETYAKLLGF